MTNEVIKKLSEAALDVQEKAYCPYSGTAFFTAIAKGERDFVAVAIAGGKAGEEPEDFCAPCGVCRQVMREFCGDAFVIILAKPGEEKVYTLKDLLPQSFSPIDVLGEKAKR